MNPRLAIIALIFLPHLIPDNDINLFGVSLLDWYWHVNILCYRLISVICMYLYLNTLKHVKNRSIFLCIAIYLTMEAITGIFDPIVGYDLYEILYLVTGFTIAALCIFTNAKKYTFKSHKIEKNNVYLCFHKPVTLKMYFGSLLGFPVGGLCIYTNGYKYGYQINKESFQKTEESQEVINRYFIVVDTGILYSDAIGYKLKQLIGTKAGKRFNCIYTLKPVLDMLGGKYAPSFWRMIPSTYSIGILT